MQRAALLVAGALLVGGVWMVAYLKAERRDWQRWYAEMWRSWRERHPNGG